MITATAQQIVDRANNELGLTPASIDSGQVAQLGTQSLALLNALGDTLVTAHDWQHLERTHTFTGDGSSSSFELPADFGRIVNQTLWSTNRRMQVGGPMTAQQWGWMQFGIVADGVMYRYRLIDDRLHVFPTPGLDETFSFYYIKKDWVLSTNGITYMDTIESGSDVPQFERGLLVKGLKVRLWAQKGFDTIALAQEFNEELQGQKAQEAGAPVLHLARGVDDYLLNPMRNVTDGFWNA